MSLNEFFGSSRANAFERVSGSIGASFDRTLAGARWLHAALHPWGVASIVGGIALACFGAIILGVGSMTSMSRRPVEGIA